MRDRMKCCIIGAGACGLSTLRAFREAGLEVDCLERNADIGGLWNFESPTGGVYDTTHVITSKRFTEYPDFPMPDSYPAYPSHRQVIDYLRSFADRFKLRDSISFNCQVTKIEPHEDSCEVHIAGEDSPRSYRCAVIANGHNWSPVTPSFPGKFDGTTLHSSQYKRADFFAGRRVLVVGNGVSGCDIAVEAARHGKAAFHSVRGGVHFVPKFTFGQPGDASADWMYRFGLPKWLIRFLSALPCRLAVGSASDWGLPQPDHKFLDKLPIPNPQYLNMLGHGRLAARPQVAELQGDSVQFEDQTREQIDVIVFATGYKISFPFLAAEHLQWSSGCPSLHMNVFHPQLDTLFFAGLIDCSRQWSVTYHQARLMAAYLQGIDKGTAGAAQLRKQKSKAKPVTDAPDYRSQFLTKEYYSYLKQINRSLKLVG